jgi:hypothetical protein
VAKYGADCFNYLKKERGCHNVNNLSKKAALLAVLGAGVFAAGAIAQEFLLRSTIIGSNPNTVIGGVKSGGAPWTVERGSVVLDEDGRLRVEVHDLILPNLRNPGPVTNVSASLVCGGSGGSVVATTDPVPLSGDGNAGIDEKINLPAVCFGPIILVRAAGFNGNLLPQPGPWIASTGLTGTSGKDDD